MKHIAAAGNTVVPALLALEALGFRVDITGDGERPTCRATRGQEVYVADEPVSVLGLVKLVEVRGWNWTPGTQRYVGHEVLPRRDMRSAPARFKERLATMPPHHLGGSYVATLTVTGLVQHFVPVLWFPLAVIEIAAFAILFFSAALLRHDEDALLAGFLVSFAVGIAILVSRALLGVVVHQSLGAVALSTPALVAWLLVRAIIFVPVMAVLIWITRRVQRMLRPPSAKAPVRPSAPPA